ncbi:MAG: class I SAM-dependent methyltransferase [Candidatus Berkelbacteria bacterium]|nr:class I SAM-dependent methyltransferase [Candidatus Berkelbacteria bacterium]
MDFDRIVDRYKCYVVSRFGPSRLLGSGAITDELLWEVMSNREAMDILDGDPDNYELIGDREFVRLNDLIGDVDLVTPFEADVCIMALLLQSVEMWGGIVKRAVDVCCGDLVMMSFLHSEGLIGRQLIGVEPSRVYFEKAKTSLHSGVNLVMGWPTELPLKNATSNLTLLVDLIHLCHEWQGVLREAVRITRKGGLIFIAFCDGLGRVDVRAHDVAYVLSQLGVDVVGCRETDREEGIRRNVVAAIKRKPTGIVVAR